ncbi:hypothetical protein SAMN05443144_104234 [Fodinibius roseus]|uniref:Uncharacterized protein n=1 Tax=Fodinibius roseus TaxID=1194090 RepID=A0A1M4XW18_9BACT|nr:hypothetical protein SAMN05443144_104234 [Fodinibius roseus]
MGLYMGFIHVFTRKLPGKEPVGLSKIYCGFVEFSQVPSFFC